MLISYLNCNDKAKLFSFSRHDYKALELDGEKFMLDGGISTDLDTYVRRSTSGTMTQGEIKDLMEDIRQQLSWGRNYNKDGIRTDKTEYALLKDLDSSHICGILSYFNNNAFKMIERFKDIENYPATNKQWHILHEIFIQELDFRINNKLI